MSAVISLTTIPTRIHHTEACINALAKQGLPVYVWIQEKNALTGDELRGPIPEWMYQENIHPVTVKEGRGPATKLLPALEWGFEKILTADDDRIYGPGWADGLLEWSEKYPKAIIAYRGRNFNGKRRYNQSRVIWNPKRPVRVEFVTTCRGCLCRSAFFEPYFLKEWRRWPHNDDIVLTAYLHRHRIPIMVVPCRFKTRPTGAHKISSLYARNAHGKMLNDEGLRRLMWSQD